MKLKSAIIQTLARSRMGRCSIAAAMAMALASTLHAASGTWTTDGNGNWTDGGNWSGGTIADGVGFTANFTAELTTATRTVTLNGNRAIGNITFTDTTSSHDLTLSGNTLTLDVSSSAPAINVTQSDRTLTIGSVVAGNEGLTKSGNGTLSLSAANNFSGTTTLSSGTLQLGNATSMGSSTLTMTSGTTLQLRNDSDTTFTAPINTPAGAVTYTFDVNNAGSAVTGKNLSLGNLTFATSTVNQINVTGGNSYTLGLGTLSHPSGSGGPWAFTINPTTAAVTITKFSTGSYGSALVLQGGNAITLTTFEMGSNGNNSLTVSGSGTVVALGSTTQTNNRSGGTAAYTLTSGTLNLTTTTSLANIRAASGALSAPTFAINGGTLNNTSGSALTLAASPGTGTIAGSPTITLSGNFSFGTSDSTSANDLNLGTGAIANAGNRTITFAGTGTTLTLGGTMSNTSGVNQTTTVNGAGNTLKLGGYTLGNNFVNVINGTGNVNITGVITQSGGTSGLTYSGSAKLTLTGANTYGGLTTVNSGVLAIVNGGSLYSTLNNNKANAITINSGGTIEFDNWTWGGSFGSLWYPTGNFVINGGTLRYVGTTANGSNSRGFTIGANGATLESATIGQKWVVISAAGNTTLASNGGTLTLTGVSDGEIGQIIPGSGGAVTKSGTGTWTLAGANTFTGRLTVESGNLSIATINNASANGTLGNSASAVILGKTGGSTGTLQYTGGNASSTKPFTMATGGTGAFQVDTAGTTLTLSGLIDGNGALTKTGAGTLSLSGTSNSYSGGTTVDAGTLTMGGAYTVLGSNSGALTVNGGTMNMAGNSLTVGNLTGSSGGTISGTSGTRTLTIGQGNGTGGNYQGIIADGGGTTALTKTGSGTITLSGSNTYTGATTINAGTLVLGATGALPAGNNVVLNGGTLDIGAAANVAGTLTVTGTSTIALGSGNLSFAGGAGTWSGTLNLTGPLGSNTLRFISGLTSEQLASIRYEGRLVEINGSGYILPKAMGSTFRFR